jgi:hypothetical protein
MAKINWDKGEFKVMYSDIFEFFGSSVVTIYHKTPEGWLLAIADMAPSILKRTKFPKALCRAAELTSKDEKSRMVKSGKIKEVNDLFLPEPKKQLFMPK